MSIEAMAIVLHHSKAKGTAKLVMLGIANHLGDGGAWCSVPTLARYANVHERNVQKAIDQLVSKGELRVHLQQGGTQHTPEHRRTNRYDVLVTCPPWCDRTHNHRDTRRLAGAQLTTNGVALSPPVPANGVAHTPPGAVAPAPPEPSSRTRHPSPVATTSSTRARPCTECGAGSEAVCTARQRAVPPEDRHAYIESTAYRHARR